MTVTYVSILAGGSGTRLWPLSRSHYPKHLIDIDGKGSMIQQTVHRVLPMVGLEYIIIVTERTHADILKQQLPFIPQENFIIEPSRRETGPCVALSACTIAERHPEAIMISLHSDAFITDEVRFRQILEIGKKFAQLTGKLITLGIVPEYAETGYGYIEMGEVLANEGTTTLFSVKRFTEKPNKATAQAFIASKRYFWNSGIFIWKVSSILNELKELQPNFYKALLGIKKVLHDTEALNERYLKLPKKAIEYLALEKSTNVAVIPSDFGWSDIGCFSTLKDKLTKFSIDNFVRGEHLNYDSHGNFIYSPEKLVATLGINDLVVIDTDDVLFVCPKHRSQEVKKIVEQLKKSKKEQYL